MTKLHIKYEAPAFKSYYLSKFALGSGITVIRGIQDSRRDTWVKVPEDPNYLMRNFKMYKLDTECHETLEEALARAELTRIRTIKSLKNQIKRLENINFNQQVQKLKQL